jgi:dTDP-4-amino-4,6-dideoxygalactose transaminase/acyl-CoA-binding protein/nucleoside-diphosphate-sugar epimerase
MSIESKSTVTISDLFHAAADLVQSSEPEGAPSNEVKLKLYGLFKRCTVGRAEDNSSEPIRWNAIAHKKYIAWKECDSLLKEDAMLKYVETASGLDGHVGNQCRSLLDSYLEQDNHETEKLKSSKDVDTVSNEAIGMRKKKALFETLTGIQSFVPRGQLDISYSDLFHALVECLKPTIPFLEGNVQKQIRLEKAIAGSWGALPSSKVHVGLSVRSLLDLYLSAKSYPKGSEVIVVPPIGIEGMMDVLHYHGIKIIPVDIDDYDDQYGPTISVNLDRVKEKLSESTVAILVVHPFGLVCTSDDEMKSLRLLCDYRSDGRPIEIWEDCAECYSGGYMYHGSPHADVQFFSFGTIKTSTALGGGVCVMNQIETLDVESISDEMRRIHYTIYEQQTRREYLTKILKAFILHIFSKNYILLGVLIWVFKCFRINYDTVITAAVKGFPSDPSIKNGTTYGSFNMCRASRLISRLRKRPHPAMMSLLFKRISESELTKKTVQRRVLRCNKLKSLLHQYDPFTILPDGNERSTHLFWLFPFLTTEPEMLSNRLQRLGFDIPRGTSQLSCVTSFIEDPQKYHSCPNTERMMSQILYIPIASIPLKDSEMLNLVSILRLARCDDSNSEYCEELCIHRIWRPLHVLPIILIFGGRYIGIPLFSMIFVLGVYFIKMMIFILTITLGTLFLMRKSLGQYYLRSTAYAKYNSMLNEPKFSENVDKQCINHNHILDHYDPIKLTGILQDPVGQEEETKVILVGATGFIGSLLLRDLLLHRKQLRLSGGVIVICRRKGGTSARERINNLLSGEMFSFLAEKEKKDLVSVLEGDLSLPQLGMSDDDYYDICNLQNVDVVINSAACVNFTEPLERAAVANITTALQLQDLTLKLQASKYIYISTAFVHGDKTGTEQSPLSENLFDFGKYRPEDLYKSMMETQSHASAAMLALGFPNTYTFTKSVCEHLLLKQKLLHTIIIRPSIVGPAIQEPFEGWAGAKPSTLVAGACLYFKSPFNIWNFRREKAPVIPVDIVSRFILHKAFHLEQDSFSDDSDNSYCKDLGLSGTSCNYGYRQSIYNAAWDATSFDTTNFLWYDFACAIVQLGTANGHVSSVIAYFVILVSFKILLAFDLSLESFKRIHKVFVHGPLFIISSFCEVFKIQPVLQKSVRKLQSFVDLPVLFFPFTTVTYNFKSELKAPDSFNGERYMFSCVVAAESFINRMKLETEGVILKSRMYGKAVIAGSNSSPPKFDIIWSLMQPSGNFAIRFIGYIVIKILRVVSTKVQVDLPSLAEVQRAIEALKRKQDNEYDRIHIILAPTHRSVLDFILVSFVAFSLPETGLQIPMIAASDEFANIPLVGTLARWAGAFFLRRGKGRVDPSLRKNLLSLKRSVNYNNLSYFEVFLEGKRSRDRRFLEPKTGFLR